MDKRHVVALIIILLLLLLGWFISRRVLDPAERFPGQTDAMLDDGAGTGVVGGPVAPHGLHDLPDDAEIQGQMVYTARDLEIFQHVMTRARTERLDTLALGALIVELGRPFVGEPYTPQTLELEGPERLVINLREFDCVTYVESVLALARIIRDGRDGFEEFAHELRQIRYRDGRLDGYPSRLHYFSEWIGDNERLGLLRDITSELNGRRVEEPVNFMTSNADAYPKLVEERAFVEDIRRVEQRLSGTERYVIPEREIGAIADGIQDGDIIAATSNIRGLDVAHTGFAVWVNGRLHLMHAPLVGSSLEISERPLAERILRIPGQDGIMVARPL
jgi:hypothetical protein